MELILILLGSGALITVSAIWRGYVLSILWAWFVVPIFGLPALSIPIAIGIGLVVGFMTYQFHNYVEREQTPTEAMARAGAAALLYPAFVLFVGWVVTFFL